MGLGAPEPNSADEEQIRRYMEGHNNDSWTYGIDDGSGNPVPVYYDTDDWSSAGQPFQDQYASPQPGVRAVYSDGSDAPLDALATPNYEAGSYHQALTESPCQGSSALSLDSGENSETGGGVQLDRCQVSPGDQRHPFRATAFQEDGKQVWLVPAVITTPGVNSDGNYDTSLPPVQRPLSTAEITRMAEVNDADTMGPGAFGSIDNNKDANQVTEQLELASEIGNDLHELATGSGDLTQDAPGVIDESGTGNQPYGGAEAIAEDDFAKRTRLKEQCFLLANIQEFATFNQRLDPHYWWAGVHQDEKYRTKAISVLQGESNTLVNLLTGHSIVQHWFELTPDQQSLLVPTIRLFKVIDIPEHSSRAHGLVPPAGRRRQQDGYEADPCPADKRPFNPDTGECADGSAPTAELGAMGRARRAPNLPGESDEDRRRTRQRRMQVLSGDCTHAVEVPFYNTPLGDYVGLDSSGIIDIKTYPEDYYASSEFARGMAGIKSFTWDYVGNNPVSARTDINAKLVMHFQSFEDIIRERPAWAEDDSGMPMYYPFKYAELAMRSGSQEAEQEASVNPDGSSNPDAPEDVDPDDQKPSHPYRLRAHIGWAIPPESDTDPVFTKGQRMAIEESFVTLYLTIIDHTFDINEDATVTFTVEYKAYIESNFGDPAAADILLTEEIAIAREERADRLELAEDTCDADTVAEVKKEHQKEIDIEKQEAYMSLINTLEGSAGWINGKGYEGGGNQGIERSCRQSRIYTLSIPFSEVDMFVNDGPFFYDGAQEWLTKQLSANPPEGWCVDNDGTSNSGPISDGRRDVVGEIEDRIDSAGGFTENNDALEHLTMFGNTSSDYDIAESDGPGQCTTMNWFYMGDLLHAALERLEQTAESNFSTGNRSKNQAEKLYKSRVVLGPIDLIDPITQQTFQVNLADVPISVNYFIDWFMQKVLAKQEARWPFMAFLREAINDLIIRVLNDSDYCFGGTVKQKAIFSTSYLMAEEVIGESGDPLPTDRLEIFEKAMNGAFKGQGCERSDPDDWANPPEPWHISRGIPNARIYSDRITYPNVERADLRYPLLATFVDELQYKNAILCRDKYYKYVIVTAGSSWSGQLVGNKMDDQNRGVYWFGIGAPRGPVKTIKFNKTDMKGVKEARFFREGFDGMSQLREPYDVDISLYGMPRIFPGTICFIDPLALGESMGRPYNPDSMAFLLGFGGYHQITKVKNKIEPGKYQTDIHCKWVQSGWPNDPRRGRLIGQEDDTNCDSSIDTYLAAEDAWYKGPWEQSSCTDDAWTIGDDCEENYVDPDDYEPPNNGDVTPP